MRIFLIGFMGVGKSTIGKMIAEDLNIPFVDLDEWIEEAVQMPIPQVFQEYGEPLFRKLEFDHLRKVVKLYDRFVMATGGGLPCFNDNMSFINDHGESFYLKSSVDDLVERLRGSKGNRPIMNQTDVAGYKSHIEQLLLQREPIYATSLHTVELDLSATAVDNASKVLKVIRAQTNF